MTEQQILPPGRERDAQVAEVVFGYFRHYTALCGRNGERLYEWYTRDGIRGYLEPWSTDPHCALDVLLEMERQGYAWSLSTRRATRGGLAKQCTLLREGYEPVQARAFDVADAITKVALRVKLGEAKG